MPQQGRDVETDMDIVFIKLLFRVGQEERHIYVLFQMLLVRGNLLCIIIALLVTRHHHVSPRNSFYSLILNGLVLEWSYSLRQKAVRLMIFDGLPMDEINTVEPIDSIYISKAITLTYI